MAEGENIERNAVSQEEEIDVDENRNRMIYNIEENPSWFLCFVLSIQHFLAMFGGAVAVPFIMSRALCIGSDHVATSQILSTLLFCSGITTLLQSTLGTRLPIVQGPSFAHLMPSLAILSLDKWKCPEVPVNYTVNNVSVEYFGSEEHRAVWTMRMREIQGAMLGARLLEMIIGATGLVGLCLRFVTPLSVAPIITLIGISLFDIVAFQCSSHWWIAIMTMVIIITFSQYLRHVKVPCCSFERRCTHVTCSSKKPIFEMFPIVLGITISWIICLILTVTNVLPSEEDKWGYRARTDVKINVLYKASWFTWPYPGQWGRPTFTAASVFGMWAGTIASIMESIGDYYTCARLSGAPRPPTHAVNRGILMEGLGCVLAGLLGSGTGLTSYCDNIGVISVTKVASRRVIQVSGIIAISFGIVSKFGAIFVAMPEPVFGGVFIIILGIIISAGISNLQHVDMTSSRNQFVFGFSLLFGLAVPYWVKNNQASIKTGNQTVDQLFTVLLTTGMLVGGVIGAILDNTLPGSRKERGLHEWEKVLAIGADADSTEESGCELDKAIYDFPLWERVCKRHKIFQYMPFCPAYDNVLPDSEDITNNENNNMLQ